MFRLYFDVPPSSHNMFGFPYVLYNIKSAECAGCDDIIDVLERINDNEIQWDWFDPANYENLHFVEVSSKEEFISLYPELFI